MSEGERLDPVHESDRITGSTPPERGAESSNVVGRPAANPGQEPFHAPDESQSDERRGFGTDEALDGGGSFDGLGVPVVES